MRRGSQGFIGGLLLLLLAGGCPQRGLAPVPARPTPEIVGFASLRSAEQLGAWWAQMDGPRNVRSAWLDGEGDQLLLELRRPVDLPAADGSPVAADAVLIGSGVTPTLTPLQFDATVSGVDFTAGTIQLTRLDESGQPVYEELHLTDGSRQPRVASASDTAAPNLLSIDHGGNGGVWRYAYQPGTSLGTGRAGVVSAKGRLTLDLPDAPQELDTGSVPFTQLAGNWEQRRAVLAAPGAGLLLVDLRETSSPRTSWLLRDSGSSAFFLQPASDTLLVLGADGIRRIGLGKLAELSQNLGVGNQLSAAQTQRLKPAVETLGWDWSSTQLSPLAAEAGRLDLFDTADIASATAELQWDSQQSQVARLLIARRPRQLDEALRTASALERDKALHDLLALLGWPDARPLEAITMPAPSTPPAAAEQPEAAPAPGADPTDDPGTGETAPENVDADDELVLRWQLDANNDTGEFSLWLTPEAAVWTLETTAAPAAEASPDAG